MAITALSGQRWQGSSTADPVTTKFLKLNSNSASNYRVSLDLQDKGGETVEDTWVIRFTRTITGGGASGGDDIGTHISYAMSNNDYSTGGTTGSQSVLGFKQGIGDGGAIAGSSTTMFPAPSNWGFANSGGADFTTVPNTYYFEIIRSGASGTGTLTAKVYTTSDYSGTPYGTASKDASSATVRYFSVANYNNGATTGSIEAEIKDFKFWNDTNSTSGTPTYTATFDSGEWGENNNAKIGVSSTTTYTDEKTTVTDVPTGSQFEETDTRKFYQYKDTGYGSNTIGTYGDMLSNVGGTLTLETDAPAGLATAGNTKCWKSTSLEIKSRTGMDANTARTFIPNDTDWSFGFWFKADTWSVGGSNSPGILVAKSSGGTNYMWFEFNSGPGTPSGDEPKFNVQLKSGGSTISENCDTGADLNWHWMLVTYDKSAGTITWYMDNTTSGVGYCTGTEGAETILDLSNIDYYLIGASGEQYQGKITDICIWNTILTSTQRGNIYGNGGSTAKLSNTESKTDIRLYHDCQSITFPITNKAVGSGWTERGTAI